MGKTREVLRRNRVGVVGIAGYVVITGLLLGVLVTTGLDRRITADFKLTAGTNGLPDGTTTLQFSINKVGSLWLGDPRLWQPTGLPGNVRMEYFAVTGATQPELIQSLANSDICKRYGPCLVDPAQPAGSVAWALESDGYAVPNAALCYTPATISYHFTQHHIVFPKWSPKLMSTTTTLAQRWDDLLGVMFTHEMHHVRIADAYIAQLNRQSQRLGSCAALITFWSNPHIWDGLDAAQNAYHAQLRADCEPQLGCIPYGWEGW